MPRKKTAASTTSATSRGHKRALSSSDLPATSTPTTRTSKRIKEATENTPTNGKVTPKKSKYFEDPESEVSDDQSGIDELSESGYEDADADADGATTDLSDQVSESEEFDSEDDSKPKARAGRKHNTPKNASQAVGDDLWREGVKTGLGPGKQVFIAKPKPRDDGGIAYSPEKIHPNTMLFLADLKKNNDREWLKRHDPDYRQSWKDWESFVEALTERIAEVDETVPELPPKDLVFRIYRDVRFSSDPTPYKPHFSAAWSRTGRKGPYAHYYVQIQPGGRSFVGSGLWHPEAQPLALLRRNIDQRPERIRGVLANDLIRKRIFDGISKDEKKAIKAFCNQNSENALKTKPKVCTPTSISHVDQSTQRPLGLNIPTLNDPLQGYEADHPNIDLLRLRNFTIGKRLSDEDIRSEGVLQKIMGLIQAMFPFVTAPFA